MGGQLLNMKLPSIICLSGMPGVGKSTLAHSILRNNLDYIIIEEVDIIREALRAFISSNENNINIPNKNIINKASYEITYNEYINQCKLLQPSILGICNRLHRKNIPVIIEGVNLDFASMFDSPKFSLCTFKSYICINLHISDKKIYKRQLRKKYKKYGTPNIYYWNKIMYRSELSYCKLNNYILQHPQYNIFNIDLSSHICTPSNTKIINFISDLFFKL